MFRIPYGIIDVGRHVLAVRRRVASRSETHHRVMDALRHVTKVGPAGGRRVLHVGITGHVKLTGPSQILVYHGLVAALRELTDCTVHGITCLADGSDQLFARALLATGATYEVILPARDYRNKAIQAAGRDRFDQLLIRASLISHTRFAESGDAAFAAATRGMLRRSQLLLAVWDGSHHGVVGGTAEAVALARRQGTPVTRIWPGGAQRIP